MVDWSNPGRAMCATHTDGKRNGVAYGQVNGRRRFAEQRLYEPEPQEPPEPKRPSLSRAGAPVMVDGVEYESLAKAAKAVNMSKSAFQHRVRRGKAIDGHEVRLVER